MTASVLLPDRTAKLDPADTYDARSDGTSVDTLVVGVTSENDGAKIGIGGPGLARSAEDAHSARPVAPRVIGLTGTIGSTPPSGGQAKPDASTSDTVVGTTANAVGPDSRLVAILLGVGTAGEVVDRSVTNGGISIPVSGIAIPDSGISIPNGGIAIPNGASFSAVTTASATGLTGTLLPQTGDAVHGPRRWGAPTGATISNNLGIGTILNDDQATASFVWLSEGPAPGINGQETVAPNNQIEGAIQAIAVHPTDPNIMYVGSVNGGIWKTTNATAAAPHWVPLTDNLPSLSIGALEFDPTDATHQTLIAGIGSTSSYFLNDQFTGVLRTTDGGATWSQLGTTVANLAGENITSVAARGATLLAAADNGWGGGLGKGLFRSTDSGANWTLISDGTHGLPNLKAVSDIVGDPLNSNVLYAAVTGSSGGVFKSTDTGLTWTNITSGIGIISSATDKIELAVHHDATNLDVFATVDNSQVLSGVFRSLNGASFVALDVPSGGTQGFVHGAIAAEPTDQNIVYVGFGGGSSNYLTRIDASKPLGSQITKISGGSFGSPHVDTREMQIDANGNLILGTDGGLFRLPTPTANTGVWSAIVGDMSVFELHSIAYDHVSHIIMAGAQDNGTLFQQTPGGATWDHPGFGDGGDVVIDDVSLAASGQSIRYFSSQNLGGWERQVYDSANKLVSTTFLASITDATFTTPVELNNVDPTRLLVGGSGHIYQSLNQGTSLTSIANLGVNGIGSTGGGIMVYGGYQGAVANPDLIYAGSGTNVLKQTASGGGFTSTSPGGGGSIRGVTDNSTNWATVFAIDDNQVFESTDAGATWVDVTHNLTSISTADFRSIEYVPGTVDDALVMGTSSGVFYAKVSGLGSAAPWGKFGANLPDVIVYDLEYDAVDNVLVAGTMGRGAWLVNNASDIAACFLRGTQILTDRGEVAVEALAIGDRVMTIAGEAKPIKWIGRRSYAARFVRGNRSVLPIRVEAGAIARFVPARDLFLSPEHALYIDGVLVPVRYLVNGASVVQTEATEQVEYFHIELATHDIILADGAPAESFADCDNRLMFHNGAEFARLYPDDTQPAWQFCAPRLDAGAAELTEIREALLWRAEATGDRWTDDPDLHLIIDGEIVRGPATEDGIHRFTIAADSGAIWLASRSAVPAEVQAASHDHRRLGVALKRIVLREAALCTTIGSGHASLREGFHDDEGGHRWTDGMARLPQELLRPFAGEVALEVHLINQNLRYPLATSAPVPAPAPAAAPEAPPAGPRRWRTAQR